MRVGSVKKSDCVSRPESGFTLVELLVVLVVLAVLAAIAFPVLVKAKQSAQVSQCLSNMRQLGIAFRMYTDDYHDRLPSAVPWGVPGSIRNNGSSTIQELLSSYIPGDLRPIRTPDGKVRYVDASVFTCPSDRGLPAAYAAKCGIKAQVPVWKQTGCSYEYFAANQKNYLDSPYGDPPQVPRTALSPEVEINFRSVRIGAPLNCVLDTTKKAIMGDIWFWHMGDRVMPEDTVAYSNTLYVDGHASRVRGYRHLEARLQQLRPWCTYTELD